MQRAYVREHRDRADSPGKEVLTREWIEQRNARDPDNPVKRSKLYRLDKADSDVFRHDQGFKDYQNTVAVEFIAPF